MATSEIAKLLASIGRNPSVQWLGFQSLAVGWMHRQSKLNHSRIKRLNVASELALIRPGFAGTSSLSSDCALFLR